MKKINHNQFVALLCSLLTGMSLLASQQEGDQAAGFKLVIRSDKKENLTLHGLNENSSVLEVKQAYEKIRNLPPIAQRLVCSGKLLDEDKKLSDYKIESGTTIYLVYRNALKNQKDLEALELYYKKLENYVSTGIFELKASPMSSPSRPPTGDLAHQPGDPSAPTTHETQKKGGIYYLLLIFAAATMVFLFFYKTFFPKKRKKKRKRKQQEIETVTESWLLAS